MKRMMMLAISLLIMALGTNFQTVHAQVKSKAMANAVSKSFSGYFGPVTEANLQPQSLSQFKAWVQSAAISPATKQNLRAYLAPAKGQAAKIKLLKIRNVTYSASGQQGDAFLIFIHEDIQSNFSVAADMVKVLETKKAGEDDCTFDQGDSCFCANENNCDCVSCTGCGCGGCSGCGSSGGGDNEVLDQLVW